MEGLVCIDAAHQRFPKPLLPASPQVLLAFYAQIAHTEHCWLWTGEVGTKGYGRSAIPSSGENDAHRTAYRLWVGTIPPGMQVLHACDTPRCVRPDHLWLGTNADNQADKLRKGRQFSAMGEACSSAVLTTREAVAIHRLCKAGVQTYAIAQAFGVSHSTVSRIGDGSRWPHVAKAEATA